MSKHEMGFQYDVNWGYVEMSIDLEAEMTFQLPQAFVDEWKSLKGLK